MIGSNLNPFRFQWAALQIDEILRLRLEADIPDRLGRLLKDLRSAYQELLGKIESSEGSKPEIATRAFKWTLLSYEPLPSEVLVMFVRRNPHEGKIQHPDLDINIGLSLWQDKIVRDPT